LRRNATIRSHSTGLRNTTLAPAAIARLMWSSPPTVIPTTTGGLGAVAIPKAHDRLSLTCRHVENVFDKSGQVLGLAFNERS
jgi:hypothetical protein